MAIVLIAGGLVTLGLIAAGIAIWPRERDLGPMSAAALPSALPTASAAPRLDPMRLLGDAKRQALEWHRDAVLLSITAGPLDAQGVAEGGRVELLYAKPTGPKLIGGADANGERLSLTSSGGPLQRSEEKAARGRVAPEPNCDFGNAWSAAQQAGTAAAGSTSLRYSWNDKQARAVWEVLDADGNVQRRLDGMSCSILVR